MTKLDAGLMTSLPASDPGSAAVWGSKRINPRPQSCLCLAWSGCPSNDDDDDVDNCYFCMTDVAGFSSKSKGNIKYPNLPSAIRPIPHSADLPPPLFTSLPKLVDEPVSSTSEESFLENDCYEPLADNKSLILMTQAFLNDLVRDLNLPKESAELLGSRLQNNNLLAPNTTYS